MGNTAKRIVFTLFVFVFSSAVFVDVFKENVKDFFFFEFDFDMDKRLTGAFIPTRYQTLYKSNWVNGSFQENTNKYFDENIPFRNWLIRIRNTIYYKFFNQSGYDLVTVGKNKFLFETRYLDAYVGKDFIGKDSIEMRVEALVQARKKLKEMGKELIIIFAPAKPRFYPEYIPAQYQNKHRSTNYEAFIEAFKKSNVPYLDFNKWVLQLKDTCRYMLIPKVGTHWSNYTAALCADSTLRVMDKMMGKNGNHFSINKIEKSTESGFSENDLGEVLNLLDTLENPPLVKLELKFENDTNKKQPSVLVISDSFYFNWVMMKIPENLFSPESQMWYYNTTAYTSAGTVAVKTLDFKHEIAKTDIVLLISVEPNLRLFPYGFPEKIDLLYK